MTDTPRFPRTLRIGIFVFDDFEPLDVWGFVEAFSIERTSAFNLCVQWHPEWQAASNPVSVRLLRAFGDACRAYRDRHRAPEPSR